MKLAVFLASYKMSLLFFLDKLEQDDNVRQNTDKTAGHKSVFIH